MPWYYNCSSGILTLQKGTLAKITGFINTHTPGLGWHELKTPESGSAAQAAADAVKEFPHCKAPTTSTSKALRNQVAGEIPGGSALVSVGQFLSKLNERQTWVRIAEGTLGIVLIAVALGHITGAGTKTPVMKALKVAKGVTHGKK